MKALNSYLGILCSILAEDYSDCFQLWWFITSVSLIVCYTVLPYMSYWTVAYMAIFVLISLQMHCCHCFYVFYVFNFWADNEFLDFGSPLFHVLYIVYCSWIINLMMLVITLRMTKLLQYCLWSTALQVGASVTLNKVDHNDTRPVSYTHLTLPTNREV